MATIRLLARSDGDLRLAGRYVVEYDPQPRNGPNGEFVHLLTTDDPEQALQFPSGGEALEFYLRAAGLRSDGKPNRPLTAFTVEIT